jgi:hypothetical protein
MTTKEPNPPSRRDEDFPKTTTVPEQWVTDALMDAYNPPAKPSKDAPPSDAQNQQRAQGCEAARAEFVTTSRPVVEPVTEESPFARRLDPFPTRADQHGAWL